MASNQTFTAETVAKLDVITPFNDLMKASVGKDSIYVRVRETLEDFYKKSNISAVDRARVVSEVLGGITAPITNAAMQVAYQIAKDNTTLPYDLAKLVADTKLSQEQADKLSEDTELTQEQKNRMVIEGWKLQADMFSNNGIDVTKNSITQPLLSSVTQTNEYGLDLVNAKVAKVQKFSQLNNTFRRDGIFLPQYDSKGEVIGAAEQSISWTPLVKAQTDVSIRQEQAFDDNMKQHAANSSANMIGLLLSTENFDALTTTDVDRWRSAVDYLNTPTI